MVFYPFWSDIGYQFRTFWSETGYGLCALVLNWVCCLEEATSLSFGDKTISFLMLTPCTCRNSLSRAPVTRRAPGLQVWNRVGKTTDLVWNRVRVSGSVPHTHTQFFWKYPPGDFRRILYTNRGSLCEAFRAEAVETGTRNRCFIEATHVKA